MRPLPTLFSSVQSALASPISAAPTCTTSVDLHVEAYRVLKNLNASIEASKDKKEEATSHLFRFYKLLTDVSPLAEVIVSAEINAAITIQGENKHDTFDLVVVNEELGGSLFDLSLRFKHYSVSIILLMNELIMYKKLGTEAAALGLVKLNKLNMNWFTRSFLLAEFVYEFLLDNIKIAALSEENLKMKMLLMIIKENVCLVLREYFPSKNAEEALLGREIRFLCEGTVEPPIGALKTIGDVTRVERIKTGFGPFLADHMTSLAAVCGEKHDEKPETVEKLQRDLRFYIARKDIPSIRTYLAYFPKDNYVEAFAREFKYMLSFSMYGSIHFLLVLIEPEYFEMAFFRMGADSEDLFDYLLKQADESFLRRSRPLLTGEGARAEVRNIQTVLDKLLNFIGGIEKQLTFIEKYYIAHFKGDISKKDPHCYFNNLVKFFVSSIAVVKLDSMVSPTKKPVDSKIREVLRELADPRHRIEAVVRNFWRSYLFFKRNSHLNETLATYASFLDKLLVYLERSDKEFSDLKKSLFSYLTEHNYFFPNVQYQLQYCLPVQSEEARALEKERANIIAFSLTQPESRFEKQFAKQLSSGDSEALMKAIFLEFAKQESIYARVYFSIDLCQWYKKNQKKIKVNLINLLFDNFFENSAAAKILLKDAVAGASTKSSEGWSVLIKKLLSDRDRLVGLNIELWLKFITFNEKEAAAILSLYLFLNKLARIEPSYLALLIMTKRILRELSTAFYAEPGALPTIAFILDIAAKHRFFNEEDDGELQAILLDLVLSPSLVDSFALPASLCEVVSEHTEAAEEDAAAAGAGDKKRKRTRKANGPADVSVTAVAAVAVAAVADAELRAATPLSGSSTPTIGGAAGSVCSGPTTLSLAGAELDEALPEITVVETRFREIQSLRAQAATHIDDLLENVNGLLIEANGEHKRVLMELSASLNETKLAMLAFRANLKKFKQSKLIIPREETAIIRPPILAPDSLQAGFVALQKVLDTINQKLHALLLDEHAEKISTEQLELMQKSVQAINWPIFDAEFTKNILLMEAIAEHERRMEILIEELRLLLSQFEACYPEAPKMGSLHLIALDINNFWSLQTKVKRWVSEIRSTYAAPHSFVEGVAEKPVLSAELNTRRLDEHYFAEKMYDLVLRWNHLLNAFIKQINTASLVEGERNFLQKNLSSLANQLNSCYFAIYHTPVLSRLVEVFAAFGRLELFGSQLVLPLALDLDCRLHWKHSNDDGALALTHELALAQVTRVLVENGFEILKITSLNFAPIIAIKIAARGTGDTLADYKAIDLTVWYGSAPPLHPHYTSQSAASLDAATGYLSCAQREYEAILERRFEVYEPSPSGNYVKDMRAYAHILKLLVRAWAASLDGEMVLTESADKLVKQLYSAKGDVRLLNETTPMLAAALRAMVHDHFNHYCIGEAFIRRSAMLLGFCQALKFSIVIEPLGVLRDIDLCSGRISYGSSLSVVSGAIVIEASADFLAAHIAPPHGDASLVVKNGLFATQAVAQSVVANVAVAGAGLGVRPHAFV